MSFRDIFKDGCETLKYMYKKFNFKHLDFHRENILTSIDGKVKLFDFDLSEIEHESGNQFISGLISGVYPLSVAEPFIIGTPARHTLSFKATVF